MDPNTRRVTVGGDGDGTQRTPQALYEALNRRFHFDYDPAASHKNRKQSLGIARWGRPGIYSTTTGTWQRDMTNARKHKISPRDGLEFPWTDRRVFVNPPYSRGEIRKWTAKMAAEREAAEIIVALLPVRTSDRWWVENVAPYADITYVRGRIKFEGMPAGAPFPSALAVYRNRVMDGFRP